MTDIVYETYTPEPVRGRELPSIHQEALKANLDETEHRRFRVPASEAINHKRDLNRGARRLNVNVNTRIIPDEDGYVWVTFRATPKGARSAAAVTPSDTAEG